MYDIYKALDRRAELYREASEWLRKQILAQNKIDAAFHARIANGNITYEHEYSSGQLTNQSDHGVYESGNSTLHDVDVLGTSVDHC